MQRHWKAACLVVGAGFSGAGLYSANLHRQPARAGTADLGTGIRCISDAVLRLGCADAAHALARRRFTFERHPWRSLVIHLLLCGPVALVHIGLLQMVNALARSVAGVALGTTCRIGRHRHMVYWAIIAVSHAINYFRKYQEREFRLAQAELQALRT